MDGAINENATIFPADRLSSIPLIDFNNIIALLSEYRRCSEKAYYPPAARSGTMQSYRVIASSLVAHSTRVGLETSEVPTLSGVIADFIEKLILYEERARLRKSTKPDDGISHIAGVLEDDMLNGQIIIKPSPAGYPEFCYRPQETKQDISLPRSSSTVPELVPLVLFIRGPVRPGDTLITLIIEEPEAHLYPAAQVDMARTIARLVRAGVRVLVTIHSDHMLKEIANLMHEGELKEKGGLRQQTDKPAR